MESVSEKKRSLNPSKAIAMAICPIGSITSRCSGKEPALLPELLGEGRPDTRERRKSSLSALSLLILVLSARARCMTWHVNLRAQ